MNIIYYTNNNPPPPPNPIPHKNATNMSYLGVLSVITWFSKTLMSKEFVSVKHPLVYKSE